MASWRKQEDWEGYEDQDQDQVRFQKLSRQNSANMPARSRSAAYRAVRRATSKRSNGGSRERHTGAHMRRQRKPLFEKPKGDLS